MFGSKCKETGCVRLWIAAAISFCLAAPDVVLAQANAPAKDVGVVTMAEQDVPRILSLPGRAVA